MTENSNPSSQDISDAVKKMVEDSVNIQDEVYKLTIDALTKGSMQPDQVREIIHAVFDGVQQGVAGNGQRLEDAFKQSMHGLDQALGSAAVATKLAIQEAGSRLEEFTEQELKGSMNTLENLEKEFVETLGNIASSSAESSRDVLSRLTEHARNSGTVVGDQSASAMKELRSQLEETGRLGIETSTNLARATGNTVLQIASGFLSGVADSLQKIDPDRK